MTILKDYQKRVVESVESFFETSQCKQAYENTPTLQSLGDYLRFALGNAKYAQFPDRPVTGPESHTRASASKCRRVEGRLIAVEAIRSYQNLFAKKKTGLVIWITHRDQIYRQTIQNLQNKNHPYRQLLDQSSGNQK